MPEYSLKKMLELFIKCGHENLCNYNSKGTAVNHTKYNIILAYDHITYAIEKRASITHKRGLKLRLFP